MMDMYRLNVFLYIIVEVFFRSEIYSILWLEKLYIVIKINLSCFIEVKNMYSVSIFRNLDIGFPIGLIMITEFLIRHFINELRYHFQKESYTKLNLIHNNKFEY